MANASSLNLMVLTPMASAAISSSRIAAQARPTREPARRWDTKMASAQNTRTR